MAEQIHKRLSSEFVEGVLEAFDDHRIGEEKACEILGLGREQLYKLRRRWLRSVIGENPFELYSRKESVFHRLPEKFERWLHREMAFICQKAELYRGDSTLRF